MRIGKALAGIAIVAGLFSFGKPAAAHPPSDDFLNAPPLGPRLTLMPIIGPAFRASYDQKFDIEKDMSEVRLQLIGTIAPPFSEISANIDARFFLMTGGATIGYHNEWHNLQFNPDPVTGRDRAGATRKEIDPNIPAIATDPAPGFRDLTNDARAAKDQAADEKVKRWTFEELRWGFVWPAYNFIGVSTFAARHEKRPNVSYDWDTGTVMNGGWNFRWEGYALFRSRNIGFIGPAFRALIVPRNRTKGDASPGGVPLPSDSACQPGVVTGLNCVVKHEFEFQYGVLAGMRPNWVNSSDTLLVRAYTTAGMKNDLFGAQFTRLPFQFLVAYMVDFDL